jgi:hypothetical protein
MTEGIESDCTGDRSNPVSFPWQICPASSGDGLSLLFPCSLS